LSRFFKNEGNFLLIYRELMTFDNFAVPFDMNFLFPLTLSLSPKERGKNEEGHFMVITEKRCIRSSKNT